MPFSGGQKGFDDSDSKPKQARGKTPGYNAYMRKKKHGRHHKAHGMKPSGVNRIKGS